MAKGSKRGRPRLRDEEGRPNPIDVHVGSRVRLRRTLLGMSQEKLGNALGLTFQQIQKYERGGNKIGASRLYELAQALDIPVSFFFDDYQAPDHAAKPIGPVDEVVQAEPDPMMKRETLDLVRAYYDIKDPVVRRRLFDMAKALAKISE
ncbi:MAG: helix-turn-helix transcriptional regulator [Alphaproteobacteria bacterium]|nr:helix-turn-helix transcriptional regulator [Alphaproteobacteria bacterium]